MKKKDPATLLGPRRTATVRPAARPGRAVPARSCRNSAEHPARSILHPYLGGDDAQTVHRGPAGARRRGAQVQVRGEHGARVASSGEPLGPSVQPRGLRSLPHTPQQSAPAKLARGVPGPSAGARRSSGAGVRRAAPRNRTRLLVLGAQPLPLHTHRGCPSPPPPPPGCLRVSRELRARRSGAAAQLPARLGEIDAVYQDGSPEPAWPGRPLGGAQGPRAAPT